MTGEKQANDGDLEQQLGRLLRHAGPRPQPSVAARDAVREATLAEWQAVVAARSARRRLAGWSAAAAVLVAGLAVWVAVPMLRGPATPLATVARVTGVVQATGGDLTAGWTPIAVGGVLRRAGELRTAAGGRVALRFGRNFSLRLDENSLVAMVGPDRVALKHGAVYVDSGGTSPDSLPLLIETPYGTVRHLGTQYEARLTAEGVRLRVREGRVAVTAEDRTHEGAAGEQLTISATGDVRRDATARSGQEWAWVGEIAPAFDIENRTLLEFLRWVGRETGREIAFAGAGSEAEARSVILRGSVEGLTPERALSAVLATTQLGYAETPERLMIDFKAGDRSE